MNVKKESTLNNVHVLLVEDDIVINEMVKNMLEDANITVSSAMNGEEAINKIDMCVYDLIFMDYVMPKLNGIETSKIIRKKGIKTPIILVSGSVLIDKQECINIGITDILDKISVIGNLVDIIKKYLNINEDYKQNSSKTKNDDCDYKDCEEDCLDFIKNIQYLDFDIIHNAFFGYNPEKNYINQLYNFKKQYADFKYSFFKCFNSHDYDCCLIKIHNLKNISRLIGSPIITDITSKLEKEFKDKTISENTILKIDLLTNILNSLLTDLETYLPKLDNIYTKKPKELIKELQQLVDNMDYRVFSFLDTHENFLISSFGEEKVKKLIISVENYNYDDFIELIHDMLS